MTSVSHNGLSSIKFSDPLDILWINTKQNTSFMKYILFYLQEYQQNSTFQLHLEQINYTRQQYKTIKSRGHFNIKMVFPVIGIPITKIRRSSECLIFIMGIPSYTDIRQSYLYNGNSYTVKAASLYWNTPHFSRLYTDDKVSINNMELYHIKSTLHGQHI